jgi:DNA mismatch endonuclease (patch repair protein)
MLSKVGGGTGKVLPIYLHGDTIGTSWTSIHASVVRSFMDTLTPTKRSELMSRVRSVDTKPEMAVRRLTHRMGFRYRLHDRKLPGKPDLVFPARRKIIFVNGCFWHLHRKCQNERLPKSRPEFWRAKLEGNRARDAKNLRALRRLGWRMLVIWECELKYPERIAERISRFLEIGL